MFCPNCGAECEDSAKFCMDCGCPLETVPVYCPNCGCKLEEDAVFCPECGTKVNTAENQKNIQPAQWTEPQQDKGQQWNVQQDSRQQWEQEEWTQQPSNPKTQKKVKKEELLIERLKKYRRSDMYPFHMPGHKRAEGIKLSFPDPFSVDITCILGSSNILHTASESSVEPSSMISISQSLNVWFRMDSIAFFMYFSLLYTGMIIDILHIVSLLYPISIE